MAQNTNQAITNGWPQETTGMNGNLKVRIFTWPNRIVKFTYGQNGKVAVSVETPNGDVLGQFLYTTL